MERKKLLRKNFVVSEQGFYVYKGGVKSKVPIGGVWLLGDIEAGFLRRCRLLLDP